MVGLSILRSASSMCANKLKAKRSEQCHELTHPFDLLTEKSVGAKVRTNVTHQKA